jgi:hypothetical protein
MITERTTGAGAVRAADALSQAFAAGEARRTHRLIPSLDDLPYAAPHDPAYVAVQLLALGAAAERLAERDLAHSDAEVQAALAALGGSGAIARLYRYARRAHHLAEAAQIERDLLAAAMSEVGGD